MILLEDAIECVGKNAEVFFNESHVPIEAHCISLVPTTSPDHQFLVEMVWKFNHPYSAYQRIRRFGQIYKVGVWHAFPTGDPVGFSQEIKILSSVLHTNFNTVFRCVDEILLNLIIELKVKK